MMSLPLTRVFQCLFTFALVSASRWLAEIWQLSRQGATGNWRWNSWARSIQPKFPEISVQNSMDRFGPTGKVSKKQVHLLRWSSFPGRTGLNFGWMDRAPYSRDGVASSPSFSRPTARAPQRACLQAINIVQSTLSKTDTFGMASCVRLRETCPSYWDSRLNLFTTLGQKKVAVVERFKQESMYQGHRTSIFGKYLFGRRFEN